MLFLLLLLLPAVVVKAAVFLAAVFSQACNYYSLHRNILCSKPFAWNDLIVVMSLHILDVNLQFDIKNKRPSPPPPPPLDSLLEINLAKKLIFDIVLIFCAVLVFLVGFGQVLISNIVLFVFFF